MKLAMVPLALGLALSSVACSSSSDGGSTGATTTTTGPGGAGPGGAGGQASGGSGGAGGTSAGGAGGTSAGGAGGTSAGGAGGSAAGGSGGGGVGGAGGAGCGQGPAVTATFQLFDVSGHVKMANTKMTSPVCPSIDATTDANGIASLSVSTGAPLFFSMSNADTLPGLTAELELTNNTSFQAAILPKADVALVQSLWTAGTGAMFLLVRAVGPNGPCSTADGVTITVPGAPNAKVVYTGGQGPDPALLSTSPDGVALAFNLPTSGFVQPTASKAGCKVELAYADATVKYTGRVPVAADTLSFAWGFVTP
jgi:hypothetical protein